MITLEQVNEKMGFDVSDKEAYKKAFKEYYKREDPWLVDDSRPSIWSRLTLEEHLWVREHGYNPANMLDEDDQKEIFRIA